MQIIILHGDDTEKSYLRLTKFIDVAKKRSWEILYDNLSQTPSLFGKERLTVIKDYKLYLPKAKFNGTLVVYHEGQLPAAFLKTLPKDIKVEKYELPKAIWKFLNNMTLEGLHEVIKTEPIEFVFAMIVWKLKKTYQSNPTAKIELLFSKLAEIDFKAKTGKLDLLSALDLTLLKYIH